MSTIRTRRAGLAAATVSVALVLTACSSGDSDHNDQDVSFAQGMIPHHRQALEMAELAADRASSAEVKDLAARIEKAQDPEIEKMSGWLESWDEEVPEDSASSSMQGMDHGSDSGSAGMSGMMDDSEMTELKNASGKAFDTMFLTMMVEHHEGAVDMAGTEKSKGEYKDAVGMAGDIVTDQTAEIEEMNKLLGKS